MTHPTNCRGNPKMCARLGYCLHSKMHRQPECKDLPKEREE